MYYHYNYYYRLHNIYLLFAASSDDVMYFGNGLLSFATGESRHCHTITINPDDECEVFNTETLTASLEYTSGNGIITVDTYQAQVILIDTEEPECGNLRY